MKFYQFQALNNTGEAERYYRAALTQKPDHIPAYLTYGKMLAKNVRLFFFFYMIFSNPSDSNVKFRLQGGQRSSLVTHWLSVQGGNGSYPCGEKKVSSFFNCDLVNTE